MYTGVNISWMDVTIIQITVNPILEAARLITVNISPEAMLLHTGAYCHKIQYHCIATTV